MADDGRFATYDLRVQAPAPSTAHDLYQVLRRLECAHRNLPPIGRALRLAHEPVRLGQEPCLEFPAGAIAYAREAAAGRPASVRVHCFGMLGPNGPLPLHLTEYVRQRVVHHGDTALARFLDLFHHRMLSFLYRAWAQGQPAVQRDRPHADRFATYVGALLGIGSPALRDRDALGDDAKLYYAGQFAAQVGHPDGLVALIEDHFRLPTQIQEFMGEWAEIPEDCLWKLGRIGTGHITLGSLGHSTQLGSRVWLRHSRFRIVLGPLTREQFDRVISGGPAVPALVALVRSYVGDGLRWDLCLRLRQDAVPAFQLGVGSVLGQSTWLSGGASYQCPTNDDLIYDPQASATA